MSSDIRGVWHRFCRLIAGLFCKGNHFFLFLQMEFGNWGLRESAGALVRDNCWGNGVIFIGSHA